MCYVISELPRTQLAAVVEFYAKALEAEGRIPLYPGKDDSPETTVLGAIDGGELIGTISFTADGPFGLHTDIGFSEKTNEERASRRCLFSAWRVATAQQYRGTPLLMDLIRETVQRLALSDMQTTLMVFPSEQVKKYKVLLGATFVSERSVEQGDSTAVAALMRVDIETLRTHRNFRDLLR